MFKEKDLTQEQLKYYQQEDEECQEAILYALGRKPIRKKLKSGRVIEATYEYKNGGLFLHSALYDQQNKQIWKGTYFSDSIECSLDGYESASAIADIVIDSIYNDISDQTDEWHQSRGAGLLKRLL